MTINKIISSLHNTWNILKNVWNTIKTAFLKYWNWKKDSILITFLKLVTVLAVCLITYLFIMYVLPILALVFVFLILHECGKPPVPSQEPQTISPPDESIARELLFDIISDNADFLDLVKPKSVKDITPTQYRVVQTIKNLTFYRFIIRHKVDVDIDLYDMKQVLDLSIQQTLQNGYPNVKSPFYNGFPYYSIFNIKEDSHHSNCFAIDVMPLKDDSSYVFICNAMLEEQRLREDSVFSTLNDREF